MSLPYLVQCCQCDSINIQLNDCLPMPSSGIDMLFAKPWFAHWNADGQIRQEQVYCNIAYEKQLFKTKANFLCGMSIK